MPRTTGYEFGDVILVPMPFTDLSATKRRPAVIVSPASYHRSRPDVLLMAVTSQVSPGKAVRKTLFQHQLHQDVELFDPAFGYIHE